MPWLDLQNEDVSNRQAALYSLSDILAGLILPDNVLDVERTSWQQQFEECLRKLGEDELDKLKELVDLPRGIPPDSVQ